MKLVTLYLDNRRVTHVMDFTPGADSTNIDYVIERAGESILFEFDADNGHLAEVVENGENVSLYFEKRDEEKSKGEDDKKQSKGKDDKKLPKFEWDDEKKSLHIPITKARNYSVPSNTKELPMGAVKYDCTNNCFRLNDPNLEAFSLTIELNNVSHTINFKLFPARNIYRAVVDFGSEASQALINCGGNVVANDIANLFDAVKETYAKGGSVDVTGKSNAEFMQFDNGVSSAFKSIYYVAKKVDPKDDFENNWSIVGKNEKIFRAVTLRDQASVAELNKNFFRLSNTKIDSLGNAQVSSIRVGDNLSLPVNQFKDGAIYRLAINCILSEVIKRISELNKVSNAANTTCGVRLTVLMPNVYDSNMVADKLADIREDVRKMIDTEWKNISAVEVAMVSESDASFLGAVTAGAIKTNDVSSNYLILDCGKGTLDFSVIGYDPRNDQAIYRSLCRGGIVGAGNALTYAVLYGMVHCFLQKSCLDFSTADNISQKESMVKKFMFNQIIQADDSARINEILLLAEDYKKNYGQLTSKPYESEIQQKFTNLNYSDFVDFVKNEYIGHSDIENYVEAQIDTIVHKVVTELNKIISPEVKDRVSTIVFTGRGFLMEKFRIKMFDQLKDKVFGNRQIVDIVPEVGGISRELNAKRLCLFIPNKINAGSYDGSLMNTAWAVQGVAKKSAEEGWLDKWIGKCGRKFKKFIPIIFLPNSNNDECADISTTLGYTCMEFIHNNPIVNIGGVEYHLADAFHNLMYSYSCIFYDGSRFKLYVEGVGDFNMPARALVGDNLYYDSLFPYVTLENAALLNTPTIPKEQPRAQSQNGAVAAEHPENDGTKETADHKPMMFIENCKEIWEKIADWMKRNWLKK